MENTTQRSAEQDAAQPLRSKKPYSPPELFVHGSVEDVTQSFGIWPDDDVGSFILDQG